MVPSIDKLFAENLQPYLVILYKAIFITAYYGLFRIGELTQSKHVLLAENVHIGRNKNKLMFVLKSSKTHGENEKPQIVKIDALKGYGTAVNKLCPFKALRKYINMRKTYKYNTEQFFVFSDRMPVQPKHVRAILKKLLIINNFNTSLYVFHGIRAGRATDLLNMGYSIETIKKLG